MKKSLIFASVIAMVAILAASCKSNVDAPKARFGYSVDELTVTFQNVSKDADSYVWDFGDGKTSTEKEPTHTYADYGDYLVKLTATNAGGSHTYSEEISIARRAIKIDGKFADWDNDKLATCKADENSKYEHLYVAKFARDDEFIYFYIEFNGGEDEFEVKKYNDDWTEVIAVETVQGHYAEQVQFYLNCGDETTGGNTSWYWEDAAADICLEGRWLDQFEGTTVHIWPEDQALVDDWLWVDAGVVGSTTSCKGVQLENGHTAVEGKILIGMLPVIPTDMLKMGVNISNPGWELEGILPEIIVEAGIETQQPLIEVPKL